MRIYAPLLLVFLMLSGCSQVVHVTQSKESSKAKIGTPVVIPEGIATKVVIRPPSESQQRQHSKTGLLAVGIANNWEIDANSALPDAVRYVFAKHYDDVIVSNECNDCGLIVYPEITQIDIQKVTMQATVSLELRIYDANFNVVTSLHSQGNSSVMSASRLGAGVAGYFIPFFGSAVGSYVVEDTVRSALDNALKNANQQLALEANGGALARTWLPKTQLRKKQHGQQEYTAEQVARSAGCDMASDGIHLTEKEFFKETYRAECWGKPEFSIVCEYGRCTLADTPEIAQNSAISQ